MSDYLLKTERYMYIAMCVTRATGVSVEDILSSSRQGPIAEARHMYRALLRKMLSSHSLQQIGLISGGCDHSTVLHSIKRHGEWYETDPSYRAKYDEAQYLALAVLGDTGEGSEQGWAPTASEVYITVNPGVEL